MLITCKCLNVSIDSKNNENGIRSIDVSSLNLTQDEECESFFKEELKEIEISKVTVQVKSLLQEKIVGRWTIEQCLNCSTHCYSTSSGRPLALVNAVLFTHLDVVARMKTYKDYSPVFRIIVKPLVIETNKEYSETRPSPQKVQTALTSLQQDLNIAIREQVTKTEERIRLYTEQQYNQLEEFRVRATKDHKALAQRIYEGQSESENKLITSVLPESEILEQTGTIPSKKISNRKKNDSFSHDSSQITEHRNKVASTRSGNFGKTSNFDSNSIDSEGLFVLEGMEDTNINEQIQSEGESDTDHDDSGSHDEGIDIHRNRASSYQLAKSLPVNVPVYSVPTNNFDKDEETLDAVDIAASIKALARSVHGDAIFGDLPRPRFSTQI